jgi:quercetin dioxygenase-like cupin family protein
MHSVLPQGIYQPPGEGESLFGGRIVLKCALEKLSITESWFDSARQGADPHFHREHADSFYVLEGELALLIGDEEHLVGPGGAVCAPPGLVHGFRSTMPTRFLNFHTPDARFAEHLRELDRGEAGGFDSIDAERGDVGPGSDAAVLLRAGEGERLAANHRVATIKIGRDELSLIEFALEPTHVGPDPHSHDDHIDSFYVLGGSVELQLGDEKIVAGPGSFVAAPPGVAHAFRTGPGGAQMLNIHAPSTGFHDRLREMS